MEFVPFEDVKQHWIPQRNRSFHQTFEAIPNLKPLYTNWEQNVDVYHGWQLTHVYPNAALYAAVAYLVGIWALQRLMRNRKPLNVTALVALWDLSLSIFSFIGAIRVVPHMLYNFHEFSLYANLCREGSEMYGAGACGLWVQLFIYSKFAELLDTVFLVLKKRKVIFLHWYHHASTLLFCWHAYRVEASIGIYFAVVNYFVHSLMYGYFFLAAIKRVPKWFPPQIITMLQISQMFFGLFLCGTVTLYRLQGHRCSTSWESLESAFLMYSTYLVLFVKFGVERFILKRPKKKRS